jgi:hypothetical protein
MFSVSEMGRWRREHPFPLRRATGESGPRGIGWTTTQL